MPGQRSREPIIYLEAMPERIEVGAFGTPYMVCPACEQGALLGTRDPQGHGSMLTCARGCGQRFWIDAPIGAEPEDSPGPPPRRSSAPA